MSWNARGVKGQRTAAVCAGPLAVDAECKEKYRLGASVRENRVETDGCLLKTENGLRSEWKKPT